MSIGLLLAWAMPPVSATIVWQWLFDSQYGLVNWLLTQLGRRTTRATRGSPSPLSFFTVATIIVVWMGVPFVAFTLFAAMTQIPTRDRWRPPASTVPAPWQRFRDVTLR